ncbi:MAG: transposase [Myxococcales bacterium]|nr:transposase [Myxococcales bacterium]
MTLPYEVHPGTTYLLTRRTILRHFLFRPDRGGRITQIILYALALAAKEKGVEVHAVCVLSTHIHIIVTDVRGNLPEFLHLLHTLIARMTKCHRGWAEEVFNKSSTSRTELLNTAAIVEEIAYTIANPVAACAVERPELWPGLNVMPEQIGEKVFRVKRPKAHLDPDNPRWPDEIELPITMPAALERAEGIEGARRQIRERVEQKVVRAHVEARARRLRFGTAELAYQRSITERAKSHEIFGSLCPRFAAAGDREKLRARIEQHGRFQAAHRVCVLAELRAEPEAIVWPKGTWKRRLHRGARSGDPPIL